MGRLHEHLGEDFWAPRGHREFMGKFINRAAAEGIVVHQIASKAPWQQGKTERHEGHFKELLDKARSEVVVQSQRDLQRLMAEVETTKNRYSNRSGFRLANGPDYPLQSCRTRPSIPR